MPLKTRLRNSGMARSVSRSGKVRSVLSMCLVTNVVHLAAKSRSRCSSSASACVYTGTSPGSIRKPMRSYTRPPASDSSSAAAARVLTLIPSPPKEERKEREKKSGSELLLK